MRKNWIPWHLNLQIASEIESRREKFQRIKEKWKFNGMRLIAIEGADHLLRHVMDEEHAFKMMWHDDETWFTNPSR